MRIIRIHQGKTLPLQFRLITAVILGLLIVLIIKQIPQPYSLIPTIALSTLVPAIWFAANILTIDLEQNRIFSGTWIMGFRFGKLTPIASVEKVFINRIKTKQTVYSLANNKNISTNYEYHAFLKLDSGEKFFLVSHPVEKRIIEKSKQVIHKLGLREEILVLPNQ